MQTVDSAAFELTLCGNDYLSPAESVVKSTLCVLAILLVSTMIPVGNVSADEVLYARYPALSPDGTTIAFTYQGDIWTVPVTGGEATRLTVHEAEDIQPHYSPDGSMILFSSRRHNNYDVYVMASSGGTPTRLTYNSNTDIGSGWFPGSDSVVFNTYRGRRTDIYKVSVTGGMPIALTGYQQAYEYGGRITSDGKGLLFNNGSGLSTWYRRDLKVGGNADVFLLDRTKDEFTSKRLTDYENHDLWPVLNEERGELYFVSTRGEWAQIWKKPLAGGETTAMTDYTGDGVQFLNSNPQGTMLVFEQGFKIWTLDPADGTPKQVSIRLKTDERDNLVERKEFNGSVEWYSLSPDEKKIAAIIHGEIFVLPAEDPEDGIRLTSTTAREKFVIWGEDSKTVYYCSDRYGNYDIFSADVTTGHETRLTESTENEVKPVPSPDGRFLVYQRGLRQLIRYDMESGSEIVWVQGAFLDMALEMSREYDWSADSKWLLFTMAAESHQMDIYAVSLDDSAPQNVSRFIGWNQSPRFSADGKKAYFTSGGRDGEKTYEIDLIREPTEFYESSFDSLFIEKDKDDKDDDKADDKEEIDNVIIDFDDIQKRRHLAFNLEASSNWPVLTPDGEKYAFVSNLLGESQIWTVNTEDDPELEQLTSSSGTKSHLTVSSDSKSLYFLEGGKIKTCDIEKGKVKTLSFTAVMDIDRVANNRQKYKETWQTLNSYFYDSTFHGTDWNAVREKYRPVVDHIRTQEEFRNLDLELMGELRASHLNIYSNGPWTKETEQTGQLGIDFDYRTLDREGVFKIAKVFEESPAAFAGILAGQYLIAVDGTRLTRETSLPKLLAGTIGKRVRLSISDSPEGATADLFVKPTSFGNLRTLGYEDWVAERRRMVDSLSNGRIAYLHIRSMNQTSLDRFTEEIVSLAGQKEGMLIDVRNNGGGWTSVHILGTLVKSPYIMRAFRGLPPTSENKYRSKAFERPMACLINNYSFSNAEIFAEGFRKLKLGKIIGEPTAGYVIGTGSYRLIDGTRIRRPSTAALTTEMEDTDLLPRYPDILVENLPDDMMNGRDPQLVRAVEELLGDLK